MSYFEVMALKVYARLIEQPNVKRSRDVITNKYLIKQLLTRYPKAQEKKNELAKILDVKVQYICNVAKS
jgi:hypothetical protein